MIFFQQVALKMSFVDRLTRFNVKCSTRVHNGKYPLKYTTIYKKNLIKILMRILKHQSSISKQAAPQNN
jgi:hypothetical protein